MNNKRKFGKRIIIFLVILGIACSMCITSGNLQSNISKDFTPRFTAPLHNNPYYYQDNIFYKCGYGIPNCTAYAWGRIYELTGKVPRLSTGNAGRWFSYNAENKIYSYGTEPRLGAIACFDNKYGGHVAVVEQIKNNIITFSNSAYMGSEFYLSTASVKSDNPGQRDWIFQGYIYPDNFSKAVSYSNSYYRVTAADGLNLRKYPDINAPIVEILPDKAQIFITEVLEQSNNRWGYTTYNGAQGFCCMSYLTKIM